MADKLFLTSVSGFDKEFFFAYYSNLFSLYFVFYHISTDKSELLLAYTDKQECNA